jgi:hypothetical protein
MYLFYVEESGERDYNPKNSQYFVLLAVGVSEDDWHALNRQVNEIKERYFGTRSAKIKSTFLRNPEKRRKNYLLPFTDAGVTEDTLRDMVEEVYTLIDAAPMTLFSVVIDKRRMVSQYANPMPATPLAYEMLLERLQSFLEDQPGRPRGLVIHDLINESPTLPHGHQKEIVDLHERLVHRGRTFYKSIPNLIEGVHFLPDDQSSFLQLADLLVYNVFRQFTDYGVEWDAGISPSMMSKYPQFERTLPKFFRRQGRLRGFGIKKFPG